MTNILETPHLILRHVFQKAPTETESNILDLLVDHHKTPLVIHKQSRQIGFTRALAAYLVWKASVNPSETIVVCGQTYDRRKDLLDIMYDIAMNEHIDNTTINKQHLSLSFANGSLISIGDTQRLHGLYCSMVVGMDIKPEHHLYIRAEQMIKVYEDIPPINEEDVKVF